MATLEQIKQLREETAVSFAECKKALEESNGDVEKAKEFLEDYRWSSYLDYLGHNNFPSLTKRDFLNNTFEEKERMISFVSDWINYKKA